MRPSLSLNTKHFKHFMIKKACYNKAVVLKGIIVLVSLSKALMSLTKKKEMIYV